ncbi:hypothetical protein SAMN04488029_1129 [Reichenbachiella faecimaris]|uniref:Uncharacterized protein n=1 Tax=Reichenbachiella faecimaris TaxID=692418 RepID=A0A1W2G8X1_REIFA|nr:hypothetical protein [Reichenbachiella faecimaris]SMD32778.1 hypothetical protein SAMN04488029_1129 [Reichenbachiella faecimaris]
MKKYIFLTLILSVLFTANTMAQKSWLMGPAAKNSKPWENTNEHVVVVSLKLNRLKKGPAAKNVKVWEAESEATPILRSNRADLKGPAAKNLRPERTRNNN